MHYPQGSPRSHLIPHTKEAGDAYYIGDINARCRLISDRKYSISKIDQYDPLRPYYSHIRRLGTKWPYMQYLANFLDETCAPPKQRLLNDIDRAERASRMTVASLEFGKDSGVRCTRYSSVKEVREALKSAKVCKREGSSPLLFVVEDLSRDLIEALGSSMDIDPRFFRGHISTYHWYNIRDPWVELPDLETFATRRNFFPVQYFQARYFVGDEAEQAQRECGGFNVLRNSDVGDDRAPALDEKGSSVGLIRSKASLWVRPDPREQHQVVGIILLDPSVTAGVSLWGGFSHFAETDDLGRSEDFVEPLPPNTTMFEQFLYWTQHMTRNNIEDIRNDPRMFMKYALNIICGHWRTVLEFARTRLIQTEWEIEDPSIMHNEERNLEVCLKRLQRWRRVLPILYEFVSAVPSRVFNDGHYGIPQNKMHDLRPDFEKLLRDIEALQFRAERVGTLAANMIAIEEAKKGIEQNSRLTRLTYLACIFIPLQFMSSVFSMTSDLASLGHTLRIYFASSIPLTIACLLAVILSRLELKEATQRWRKKVRK